MTKIFNIIFSARLSVLIIIVFVIAQIVATFLPTEAASWRYIYATRWFELIMWIFGINLTGAMFKYKTYKKIPVFILHLSVIVVLIGAGITRYAGYSGILHLREGQTKSFIVETNKKNPSKTMIKHLGFKIKLDRFVLKKYPGSMQPSSFDSYVTVEDGKHSFSYHIYMNHILSYKGYRFYQADFDKDAKGSILSVSYDPGMYVVYFGYFLLIVGFLLVVFYKKGRFVAHIKRLKTGSLLILSFISILTTQANAFDLQTFAKDSTSVSKIFSSILVQHNGRIEPMDTLDMDIVHKLTKKSKLLGLNYNQIVIGMITEPKEFQRLPLIYVKDKNIRKLLNIKGSYASYNSFFDKSGRLKFIEEITKAFHTPDSKRTTPQREWLKINEMIYISSLVYTYDIFKLFPTPNAKEHNYGWYSPFEIEQMFKNKKIDFSGALFYLKRYGMLIKGLKTFNPAMVGKAKQEILKIQKTFSGGILPTENRIKWEIIYNHMQIFTYLIGIYSTIGFFAILLGFVEVLREKRYKLPDRGLIVLSLAALLLHTANMIIRWYIAGHAPWSDAYESIIFIAWGSAFASVTLFRKSMLSLGSGLFSAGMFMMVANLDNINPQITNVVPVLNSYWLLIHVAFSIISYGFMSVGAMLGLLNLLLYALKHKKPLDEQTEKLNNIIYISLYIGFALLSIGTIFGAVWANESWGAYWSWDPKETWSLISILIYAYLLHEGIMYRASNGIFFSLLAFLSFFFILMTYFGVNFYIAQGLHSYGRGSAGYGWFYLLQTGIVVWFGAVISKYITDMLQSKRTKPT